MKKIKTLGSAIDELIEKFPDFANLPDDDPEASRCPYCDGYGNIIDENGKARTCVCVRREIIQSGIEEAHIPTRYASAALDNFDTPTSSLKASLSFAKNYVANYSKENPKGLYIYGSTGSGKTHLAIGIMKGLIEKGFDGVFYNVVDLLDAIRATFDPASNANPKGKLTQELDRQVIVLDDFGVQKTSTWVVDRLYALINRRYQDCKTLIITSNIKAKDLLMQVEKRLVSRIVDMCEEIEINADDYRLRGMRPPSGRGRSSNQR